MCSVISLLFVKHELLVGNKAIIIMVQDYDCHNFVSLPDYPTEYTYPIHIWLFVSSISQLK